MYEVISGLYFSAYQTRIPLTVRRGQGTTQSKQQEIDYKRQKRNKPRSPALRKDYCSLSHDFRHLDKRSGMFNIVRGPCVRGILGGQVEAYGGGSIAGLYVCGMLLHTSIALDQIATPKSPRAGYLAPSLWGLSLLAVDLFWDPSSGKTSPYRYI